MRAIREKLTEDAHTVLPMVMLSAFTQQLFAHLWSHWRQQEMQWRIRGIVKFWCHQRRHHHLHSHAAHVLIRWLGNCVAVRTLAFRVFRGIRLYLRRVRKVQLLWRRIRARRQRHFMILERHWIDKEIALIDAAAEKHEASTGRVRLHRTKHQGLLLKRV